MGDLIYQELLAAEYVKKKKKMIVTYASMDKALCSYKAKSGGGCLERGHIALG